MLALSITLATAALVASHGVDVRSSIDCPSSQDIAERLRPLLPDGPAQGSSPDIATVEVAGATGANSQLRIRLVRGNGSEVGDRRVLVQGDCAETAATVAAVIAAWESEPLASAPPSTPVSFATPVTFGTATSSAWRVLVGVGGGVGLVGGIAGSGGIEAVGGKRSSRLQGRIGIADETSRSLSLSPGKVDWQHTAFDVGVLLRTLHPDWPLSFDAGLALGWATLQGRGFSQDRTLRSFEYGAVAALRLGRNLGHWCVWAEARTYGWVQGQRASLRGETTAGVDLPLVDVTASVGLSAPLIW